MLPVNRSENLYFGELQTLSVSEDKNVDSRIVSLLKNHSYDLIADLIEHPEHQQSYTKIEENLCLKTFRPSFEYLQLIARCLKENDAEGLEKLSNQMSHLIPDLKLSSILVRFSSLNIHSDFEEIRAISHPKIRSIVIANLINRDHVPLADLKLTKYQMLEIAPYLTFVDCKNCLEDFKESEINRFLESCSKNVKTLKISTNLIKTIPSLPKCQVLECVDCNELEDISELPSCQNLNCSKCKKLMFLPELPLCQILNGSNCTILRELPELKNCKNLNCMNCTALSSLPELKICETLNCNKCNNLTELPDLPLCQTLHCSYCINLQRLSELTSITTLNCTHCTSLIELPELNICRSLFCSNCTALTRLPTLPSCHSLYCTNCTELLRLPELTACETLNSNGCTSLDLNTIPFHLRPGIVLTNRNVRDLNIQVPVQNLNEDPLKVLLNLEDTVLNRRILPRIQFVESGGRITEAADAGGVSRVFISRLTRSLISHSQEPKQLAFKEMKSGLHLPILDTQRDLNVQIKGIQILGALFDQCIGGPGFLPLTTGIVFDHELFQMMVSLSYEDLNVLDLEQINRDPSKIPDILKIKVIAKSNEASISNVAKLLLIDAEDLTSTEFDILKEIVLAGIDEDSAEQLEQNQSSELVEIVRASVTTALLESIKDQDIYLPVILIAKQLQLRAGTKAEFDALILQGADNLDKKIQGVLDPQGVFKAINWSVGERQLNKTFVDNTMTFVKQWINEASPQDLMNFNSFITGSPTLRTNTTLFCNLYDTSPDHLPTSHSCSNVIDLSINYPEYKDFKIKLEMAIASVNNLESSGLEIK